MAQRSDTKEPGDLANRVDRALEAIWKGSGDEFDRLIEADEEPGPTIAEMFRGVLPGRWESGPTHRKGSEDDEDAPE